MAYLLADAAEISGFFYKHAYLDYDQLICDGFYYVRKKFLRLPSLAELEANPQLSSGQVAMLVDRLRDQPLMAIENLLRGELPKLRSGAERATLLANVICEAFGNYMGAATYDAQVSTLDQLKRVFGMGPLPVGELVAAGLGGARSRSIAFKAIADALPSDQSLPTRLVQAPYPATLMHELQLHAWNDVQVDGEEYVVDLMDDAGVLYKKASQAAAQYETIGREDDPLLMRMLASEMHLLPAGQFSIHAADIIRDEIIRKSSCAEVYKVVTTSGHTMTVKRLNHCRHTNADKQQFKEEISALATLDHPNITRILGACANKNELFIMMEYFDGGSLVDLLASARELLMVRCLEIALDIGRGLSYLHNAEPPVVHCDVQGNNILICMDESAKLTDVGVSIFIANATDSVETDGLNESHLYDVRYAAPEVLEGKPPNDRSDVYAFGMLLYEICTGNAPWAQTQPTQIRSLVLAQKRPVMPADARFGMTALIQMCWSQKPAKRPPMTVVVEEIYNVSYTYLMDANGRHSLGAADLKVLNACISPGNQAPTKRAAQRQEFAARVLGQMAHPDGDESARLAIVPSGSVPALLALLEGGSNRGKETAAEALGALVWNSFGDPQQRDLMRDLVLPVLIQQLGATTHDGCRCAILATITMQNLGPGTSAYRAALLSAGGISALVRALQDGSLKAKAAASRLLLIFAAEVPDSQEWIAAAPGAIAALVHLLRSGDTDSITTATQILVILADIPHTRQDALAAGAVPAVLRILAPTSDDTVTIDKELAAVLLSKYALEPEAHDQIAVAGAIPVLARGISLARDAGRERMLVGVLRTLGAVSERSSINASSVIASRSVVPAFQLLSSRLPAVQKAAAFMLGCLFSCEASTADAAELTSIEGRLIHFLVDLIVCGPGNDHAYGAVMLARILTSSGNAPHVARDVMENKAALGALLAMLVSSKTPVRLAAVRALAKVAWLGARMGLEPERLSDAFVAKDVVRSEAIGNLTDMLESVEELTRYTAAKILISLWMAATLFQEDIIKSAVKPTGVAFSETLLMAGGGASRADVLELCAAVLNVKSGPSVLETVQVCPDWAAFFWLPEKEVVDSAICRTSKYLADSSN